MTKTQIKIRILESVTRTIKSHKATGSWSKMENNGISEDGGVDLLYKILNVAYF